ncbi:hypothetical protein BU23DRAFT_552445 [Bimuria novae-zelandiae CBS 107.79]|uniref:Uncharacterized protein n=1 Tax=Bimuria novae-zelandiae CBS 107.79 TaxID=1447943 RepID=A0A6A5VED7_9PLEO|nr:hypothetical protein BU23DRAFT_552445 [Bimuria novae-zelandiae CBS 107.79]
MQPGLEFSRPALLDVAVPLHAAVSQSVTNAKLMRRVLYVKASMLFPTIVKHYCNYISPTPRIPPGSLTCLGRGCPLQG